MLGLVYISFIVKCIMSLNSSSLPQGIYVDQSNFKFLSPSAVVLLLYVEQNSTFIDQDAGVIN